MDGFLDFYTPRQDELLFTEATFCALDFETTGLYPDTDEIIEIGAARFRGGIETDSFSTLIRPERPIPVAATAVHGIDDAMVAEAPSLEEALPLLLDFLSDSILLAHNVNFDLSFLKAACSRYGLSMPKGLGIDSCTFAREVLKGEKGYSLQKLAAAHGLSDGRSHRALDDARTCAALFRLIVSRIPGGTGLTARELFRLSRTRPLS